MTKLSSGPGWAFIPDGQTAPAKTAAPGSPKPKIYTEKRGGKKVTVIAGLHTYGADRLDAIAKELKASLGAGGTVKNGCIEIQGDNLLRIKEILNIKIK